MNAKHTNGTLDVAANHPHGMTNICHHTGVGWVKIGEAKTEPDARRLVACWNACEGLSTKQIGLIADHHEKVQAQRDALLAAARDIRTALDDLLNQKPKLASSMAGSTTLGNQCVHLLAAIKQVEAEL